MGRPSQRSRLPRDNPAPEPDRTDQGSGAPWSRRRWIYSALLAAGIGVLAATIIVLCYGSPAVHYLAAEQGGEWIVYPAAVDLGPRAVVEQTAVFRRSFRLARLPEAAPLRIRACDRFVVQVNGEELGLAQPADANWKRAAEIDALPYVRPGENRITVSVSNSRGPPAVWLAMEAGDGALASDRQWQVSLDNRPFLAAALAVVPPESLDDKGAPLGERSWDSLLASRWTLLWYALASCAAVGAATWCTDRVAPRWRLRLPWAVVALATVAVLWLGLFWNNLSSLDWILGFDNTAHAEYIDYVQQRGALPLADEGWEMYQPPLYYALNALVLKCCGLSVWDEPAAGVLRFVSVLLGVVHAGLIFASLRLVFPEQSVVQGVGLLLAAFTPLQLYMFQFVGNEVLLSVLAAGSIYVALRMLKGRDSSVRLPIVLGLCLGAAVLTKITGLLLIVVIPGALAAQLLVERRYAWQTWLWTIALPLVLALAVSGWHYARVWAHFGSPLVLNPGPQSGFVWWQTPGYSHAAYFLGFGRAVNAPHFSVFHSFADGAYSTLWGDGAWGGASDRPWRLPWNYRLMGAGYLLALLPTALVLTGAAAALVGFLRQPSAEWLLLIGLAVALVAFGVCCYLANPFYCMVKASYGLSGMTVFCLLGGGGFAVLGKRRFLGVLGAVALGVWALVAYASYWVSASAPETLAWRALVRCDRGAVLAGQGENDAAVAQYRKALEIDPGCAEAHFNFGLALSELGRLDEAIERFQEAVRIKPQLAAAQRELAAALARREGAKANAPNPGGAPGPND